MKTYEVASVSAPHVPPSGFRRVVIVTVSGSDEGFMTEFYRDLEVGETVTLTSYKNSMGYRMINRIPEIANHGH